MIRANSKVNDMTEIESIIREVYSKHYPKQDISKYQMRFKRLTSGPYTNTFWCEPLGSGLPRLFIKDKKKTDQDMDTQLEYQTMTYLWELGYDSEAIFKIPRPYHYDDKNNLLVTEFVQGRKLSRILAVNLRFPMCFVQTNRNVEYIRRTALWLTEYEKKVQISQMIELAEVLKGYLDYKVDDISFLSVDEKEKLKISLQTYNTSFGMLPSLLTNIDFKIHNVIMNGKVTIAIDWEKMKDECIVFWMPATFLRSLDNAKVNLSVYKGAVNKLKEEFLRTYWNNTPFNELKPIFPLIYSLESITYLAELKTSQKRVQIQTFKRIKMELGLK